MPVEGEVLFKNREEILTELQDASRVLIPDVYLGEDGVWNIILQVTAAVIESVFLSNQIVSEDMFVQTANEDALEKWGVMYADPRKQGTKSQGELRFSGDGGVAIPVGAEVAYDPGTGEDPLYFVTIETGTLPNPGIPTAPTVADSGLAGNPDGTLEYALTFVTAEGETEIGESSDPVTVSTNIVNLTALPQGGPGTTNKRIYRQKNADGIWKLVTTLANATLTYDDNTADGSLGGNPPEASTAERITLAAESEQPGEQYDVLAGTITTLTDVPDGVVHRQGSALLIHQETE